MRKTILAVLTAVVLCLGLFTAPAQAARTVTAVADLRGGCTAYVNPDWPATSSTNRYAVGTVTTSTGAPAPGWTVDVLVSEYINGMIAHVFWAAADQGRPRPVTDSAGAWRIDFWVSDTPGDVAQPYIIYTQGGKVKGYPLTSSCEIPVG